ncbi:MAG: nucleoid-associated protein [Bacteroidales bacterium]
MIYANNATLVSLSVYRTGSSDNPAGSYTEDEYAQHRIALPQEEEACRILLDYLVAGFTSEAWFHFQRGEKAGATSLFGAFESYFEAISAGNDSDGKALEPAYCLHPIAKLADQKMQEAQMTSCYLFVAHFEGLVADGEITDAVGLFLAEGEQTALSLREEAEGFRLSTGNILKPEHPERGCIVFATEKEAGFLVAVSGDSGKAGRLWREVVLDLQEKQNDYLHTKACMGLCKEFVTERLPEAHPVDKATQAGLLHRSERYFKENDSFSVDSFAEEVIRQPEMIESFKSYREELGREQEAPIPDQFDISEAAVKKGARVFKSAIKLDKNFHIYVHGDRERIRKGFDPQTGLHYYQIFFEEEL